MTERNIIIHCGYVPEEEICLWRSVEPQIRRINDVIKNSTSLAVVDENFCGPYKPMFDTVVIRRTSPMIAVDFVSKGDVITLFGCRTTVCVQEAWYALVESRKLKSTDIHIDPDGTFD